MNQGMSGGDFQLGTESEFCYQHDVRIASQSGDKIVIGMHNNNNADFTGTTRLTTGMEVELDFQTMKTTLLRRMWNAQTPVFSISQGSYQELANKHVLMGQGAWPLVEEYDENGALVMNIRFGYDYTMQSYRAYRWPWVGTPKTKPSVYACRDSSRNSKVAVYVSWNGATGVQQWTVYGGPWATEQHIVGSGTKNGFETVIWVDHVGSKLIVEAVGGPNNGVKSDVTTVAGQCS